MEDRADAILRFWFGDKVDDPSVVGRWFTKDAAFDDEIRRRFGDDIERAARGELDAWADAGPEQATRVLAYVVLLDQCSRNVFRGDARTFAQDARALRASLRGQEQGVDRRLSLLQRYVFYLPMMHSEDRDVQRAGVAAYARLIEDAKASGASPEVVSLMHTAHDYAVRHQVIVERFGRFPHRNAVLGRESTPEEVEFLKQPGSSF